LTSTKAHFSTAQEDARAGRVAQEIECLPSKHKALSSNPSTTKKKKGARRQRPSFESHPFNGHSAGVHTNTHDIYFFRPGASVTRTLLHILGGQTTVAFCQYVLLDTNTHTNRAVSLCPILLSHVSQRHIPFQGEGTTYGHAFYCDSWEQASLGTSLWPP
jgi:hypothetical protein